MNKLLVFIPSIWILCSCGGQPKKDTISKVYAMPKSLKEISGIALANHQIYTLEDSNNKNEVYVLDDKGEIIRTITLDKLKNNDWEDLTFDKKGNLYIGDFGNNDNTRKDLAIYKIDQKELQEDHITHTTKISFQYPEQVDFPPSKNKLLFDVEGFFELDHHFYLFTKNRSKKSDGTSYVYKIPNQEGNHNAELIGTFITCSDFENCAITSAAISPDFKKIVLLSHSKVWVLADFPSNNILKGSTTEIALNHFSQKEAICFKNESEIYIADEAVKKEKNNLYLLDLKESMK